MITVGIRHLKNRLSFYLKQVERGRAVQVTERGRNVALIIPVLQDAHEAALWELITVGRIAWAGGKPHGARRPVLVHGPSVARAVMEDRR